MNIILFGPPGVGKSTTIGDLKLHFVKAIDLEDVYPSSIRFQLPSMVDEVVFGGADLNPRRSYRNTVKILLYLPQEQYDVRRKHRDEDVPSKGSQKQHFIQDWIKNFNSEITWNVTSRANSRMIQLIKNILHAKSYDDVRAAYQHYCDITPIRSRQVVMRSALVEWFERR